MHNWFGLFKPRIKAGDVRLQVKVVPKGLGEFGQLSSGRSLLETRRYPWALGSHEYRELGKDRAFGILNRAAAGGPSVYFCLGWQLHRTDDWMIRWSLLPLGIGDLGDEIYGFSHRPAPFGLIALPGRTIFITGWISSSKQGSSII